MTKKKRSPSLIKEKYTKSQIVADTAETTGVSRKQVAMIIDELGNVIERHIKKRAAGAFVLPGLLKISTIRKPATKERKGINPFTGEETVFKARPARTVVKVRPLKGLLRVAEGTDDDRKNKPDSPGETDDPGPLVE